MLAGIGLCCDGSMMRRAFRLLGWGRRRGSHADLATWMVARAAGRLSRSWWVNLWWPWSGVGGYGDVNTGAITEDTEEQLP
jgi:hypothetical protein